MLIQLIHFYSAPAEAPSTTPHSLPTLQSPPHTPNFPPVVEHSYPTHVRKMPDKPHPYITH